MNFSTDWFSQNIPNFELGMDELRKYKTTPYTFLEIGVFEGRSTCWLLENGLGDKGTIYCVDPFYGVKGFYIDENLQNIFRQNTEAVRKPQQTINLFRTTSYDALAEFIYDMTIKFDFIYVDGAHDARSTLTDLCMSWGLLKKHGIMIIDDYEWEHGATEQEKPKLAIDCFLKTFEGKYQLLFKNYQVGIQRL